MVLAEKVEEYRSQENILHNAFINAEKMKESVLAEARQTSEILLRDAQTKADRILDSATGRVDTERANYEALQQEVAKFKNTILDVYKSHLGIIASLPDYVSEDALNEALADAKQDAPETGEPEDADSQLEDLMEEVPFDSAPEVTEELETEEPAAEAEEPAQQEEPAEEAEDSVFGEAFTF
jgi:cell division initiation protein